MYNGRFCQTFSLKDIEISPDHKITSLTIQDRRGNVRYTYNSQENAQDNTERFNFSQPIRVAATAQPKRKTRYTNDEFIKRMSEEKQKYLNDYNALNKLKKFYEWWISPDAKDPQKSRVEAMNFFDFEQRIAEWLSK